MRLRITTDPSPTLTITTSSGVVARLPVVVVAGDDWLDMDLTIDAPDLTSFAITGEIGRVGGWTEEVKP